jgi:xanthine dehydrogenase accessory factor
MTNSSVSAILLAAGLSSRMGKLKAFEQLARSVQSNQDVALITIIRHADPTLVGTKYLLQADGTIYDEIGLSERLHTEIVKYCLPLLKQRKTNQYK